MSAVIFIEELDRAGRVERRQRVAADHLTLGRGYDTEVILDDPLVAPHHLQVELLPEGRLRVRVVDSDHPCAIGGQWGEGGEIGPDDIVQIGHTRLRFRTPGYQVANAPRRSMRDWLQLFGLKGLDWALLALVVCTVGIEYWLVDTETRGVSPLLLSMASMGAAMLVWAGFWSLLSRLLVKHFEFHRHLALCAAALLCVQFADWLLVPLGLVWLPDWLPWLAIVATAVALLFGHLRLCAHGDRGPATLAAVLALAGGGIGGLDWYIDAHRQNSEIPADVRIVPLPSNWLPTTSSDAFFDRAKTLGKEADDAAKALD
ncbi:FHA domain-containing protein [Chitinimonas arctica]|uniref:FHA domain-containing protein n=1 Tax=Chitinimonas arctica TaxID=2594795 RepID=A0A516SDD0_9NEIS|nr:FHA domain-containing protein [Chitinimonas arctica]QDQ26156.1 FHA domain-containing protein [Chitinimonas arctica]